MTVTNTMQFKATGTLKDGTTSDYTSLVIWSSSDLGVATVDKSGLATAFTPGSSTITATVGKVTGTAMLTVSGPSLSSIAVTPSGAGISVGGSQQFTATAQFDDASTKDLTSSATWSSSDASIASVSSSGSAMGVAAGVASITAKFGQTSGSTALNVVSSAVTGLNGTYVFSLTGVDSRGPQFYVGTFTADGKGGLTGVEDANTATGVTQNAALTGTYTTDADGRGSITLSPTGLASITFRYTFSNTKSAGQMIEFDGKGSVAGQFGQQTATTLTANSTYVFRVLGLDATGMPLGQIGFFATDSSAQISGGQADANDAGAPSGAPPNDLTASAFTAPDGNGRGTIQLAFSTPTVSFTANYAYYVTSTSKIYLIQTDETGTLLAGTAEMADSSSSDLGAGGFVLYVQHSPSLSTTSGTGLGTLDTAGQLSLDGSGKILSGEQDQTSDDLLHTISSKTASTYTDPTLLRRGTITEFTTTDGTTETENLYLFYTISKSKAFVMNFGSPVAVGALEMQPSSTFTNATLSGTYAFSASQVGVSGTAAAGVLTADGAGNLTGIADVSTTSLSSAIVSGIYTVSSDGRTTVTLDMPVGAVDYVFYLLSPTDGVLIGQQPSLNGLVQLQ